jgi:hypothetical protein
MAEVVGRNSGYPRHGVTVMGFPRHDVTNRKRPNFRSLTPKASGVTVKTRLFVKAPTGRTRPKVSHSLR